MTKPTVEATMTDLGDLDTGAASDAGTEIELKHPTTKKPTGIFIGVVGKHSQIFRDIVRERTNDRIRREAENAQRGKEPEPTTAEEVEARAIELLTACTTHWRSETRTAKGEVTDNKPIVKFKGEELTFNAGNVAKVYTAMIWAREQVDAAIGDLELFIKA